MSYFTDPMAALEEAEYRAKEEKRTMCVVEVEPNRIVVVLKKEAVGRGGIILETCVPFEENHNIYD
jgi:hypothetical protein